MLRRALLTALLLTALFASYAAAHQRGYVALGAGVYVLGFEPGAPSPVCLDGVFDLGSDLGGVCYRPNHFAPNFHGDVSFSVTDAVQVNVGFLVCQDVMPGGGPCGAGDSVVAGCNSVTVNGLSPARTTYVVIDDVLRGSAAANFFGGKCGLGVDSYGTTGTVNHS